MPKSGYWVHVFAAITCALGLWIFLGETKSPENNYSSDAYKKLSDKNLVLSEEESDASTFPENNKQFTDISSANSRYQLSEKHSRESARDQKVQGGPPVFSLELDPEIIVADYIAAWNNRDKSKVDVLWAQVIKCRKCLLEFVDLVASKKFEEGLLLEVAIRMAALDSDIVLPIFDALIDPAGDTSTTVILSEKLINNGRPEFVSKIFDIIYHANENGYENFSRQLAWVVTRLENPEGIKPILDTITGRGHANPKFSDYVSNVFSKVVPNLPEASNADNIIASYYLQANTEEQLRLWPVASNHGGALVSLAVSADKNGQHYDLKKYTEAMSKLPHLQSVDSLMKIHAEIEYSPDYLQSLLSSKVADNPTIKVLHRLEDYMRDPNVKVESRFFAAEGLLSIRQNRQARYILEKVINNTEEPDAELQAYIGGRL